MKVGFIGLGVMGRPMAKQLVKAGVDLIVSDLNAAAVEDLVSCGAKEGSYAEIGRECDVIITMLPNGSIVKSVLFGENAVASTLSAGKIVCDMSSVTPTESRYCYEKLRELGVGFVDAPVSGGEVGAEAGSLVIMCGGDEADYEKMLPYFDIMGSSAVLIGDSGAGSVTKLVNQIIVNLNIAVISEAMVLASKAGVDPMKVYKAIRGGFAGSAALDAKVPTMCAREFTKGGKFSINHKDIKNVIETAHAIDAPVPFSAQLFEIMQSLKVQGHMDEDHSAIVKYFEMLAGTEVRSDMTE